MSGTAGVDFGGLRLWSMSDLERVTDQLGAVYKDWRELAIAPLEMRYPGCVEPITNRNRDIDFIEPKEIANFTRGFFSWCYHRIFLPSCSHHILLDELEYLPTTGGVYFVSGDWPHRCLYVGVSGNFKKRWKAHHKMNEIVKSYRHQMNELTVSTLECDPETAYMIERLVIATAKPPMNHATTSM